MPENRRKFDAEFGEGAVRLVSDAGEPTAAVARGLGPQRGHFGQMGAQGQADPHGHDGPVERGHRRARATGRGERGAADGAQCPKRCVVLWAKEAMK